LRFSRVAALRDLEPDVPTRVEVNGRAICLARCGDEVFAVDDVCSHANVSLSVGDIEDCTVECWLHGSRFDLRTGKPLSLPATRPVATFPTRIEGDDVLVAVKEH
jgi:nitrite reductase/ring-hydroxylating ferredoxin subunit